MQTRREFIAMVLSAPILMRLPIPLTEAAETLPEISTLWFNTSAAFGYIVPSGDSVNVLAEPPE